MSANLAKTKVQKMDYLSSKFEVDTRQKYTFKYVYTIVMYKQKNLRIIKYEYSRCPISTKGWRQTL